MAFHIKGLKASWNKIGLPRSQPIDLLQFQPRSELIFFGEKFHIDSKMYNGSKEDQG